PCPSTTHAASVMASNATSGSLAIEAPARASAPLCRAAAHDSLYLETTVTLSHVGESLPRAYGHTANGANRTDTTSANSKVSTSEASPPVAEPISWIELEVHVTAHAAVHKAACRPTADGQLRPRRASHCSMVMGRPK